MRYFPEKQGKGQQRGKNPNLSNHTNWQSAHREYSSVNDICNVVDLKHGFDTRIEDRRMFYLHVMLETIALALTFVKITSNYFPCVDLHKVKIFIRYAQGLMQLLLLIFT